MRGFERDKAIADLVRQRRRARIGLEGPNQFYDLADLGEQLRNHLDIGWRHPLSRGIIAHGLAAHGLTPDQVAVVLAVDLAITPTFAARAYELRPEAAQALQDQATAEIPETPEPGRFVAPQV